MNKQKKEMWKLCEKTTEKICKILNIKIQETNDNIENFTEKAQYIFNDIVDLTDNVTIKQSKHEHI